MTDFTDFRSLIAAMGGPARAAKVAGLDRRLVNNISARNSASDAHWRPFALGAATLGLDVDERDFARWAMLARLERKRVTGVATLHQPPPSQSSQRGHVTKRADGSSSPSGRFIHGRAAPA